MAPTQFMSTIGWYFVCDSNDDGSIYNFMFFAWILLSLEILHIHFILLLCLTSQNMPPNANSLQWICWHQWTNELRFCWSVHRFTLNLTFFCLYLSTRLIKFMYTHDLNKSSLFTRFWYKTKQMPFNVNLFMQLIWQICEIRDWFPINIQFSYFIVEQIQKLLIPLESSA